MLRKIKAADVKGKGHKVVEQKLLDLEGHIAAIFGQYPHISAVYVDESTGEYHVNKPFDVDEKEYIVVERDDEGHHEDELL